MPEWIWDPDKNVKNRRRHGLSLTQGGIVLEGDIHAVSRPDPHPDGDRLQTIGEAVGMALLFVVHTVPVQRWNGQEQGRIISVRKATPRERRAYEEGSF